MALQWVGAAWKAIHEMCLVRCGVFVHHTPRVSSVLLPFGICPSFSSILKSRSLHLTRSPVSTRYPYPVLVIHAASPLTPPVIIPAGTHQVESGGASRPIMTSSLFLCGLRVCVCAGPQCPKPKGNPRSRLATKSPLLNRHQP